MFLITFQWFSACRDYKCKQRINHIMRDFLFSTRFFLLSPSLPPVDKLCPSALPFFCSSALASAFLPSTLALPTPRGKYHSPDFWRVTLTNTLQRKKGFLFPVPKNPKKKKREGTRGQGDKVFSIFFPKKIKIF